MAEIAQEVSEKGLRDIRISQEQMEEWEKRLNEAMPDANKNPTVRQAVFNLYPSIEAAIRRGFTRKEIYWTMIDAMTREKLTYPTFLSYVRQAEMHYSKKRREEELLKKKAALENSGAKTKKPASPKDEKEAPELRTHESVAASSGIDLNRQRQNL